MAIATELVTRKYLNIVTGTPIPVDYPAFEAEDVTVYYGNASLVATLNVDYTIVLDEENFNTFVLTPLAALLTKINNLIAADATETNFIVVRRVMDFLTVTNEGAVRDTRFLSRELDRTAMRFSQLAEELSRAVKLSLRFVGQSAVIDELVEGAALIYEGGKIKAGPTFTQVALAQQYAEDAGDAQLAAEAARDEAIAKENSMLRDRGAWLTGILYSPSDIFTDSGNAYITQTAHFATSIAADLSANRIRVFAAKGTSGSGSGDMNNADNLSGLTDKPLAYATIGGKAVGKVDLLPFSLIDPAVVITDTETLKANKTAATAFPTAKGVVDYVDPYFMHVLADKTVSGASAATLPFTEFDNAKWDFYEFEIVKMLPTVNALLLSARLSTDGVNYAGTTGDYSFNISGTEANGSAAGMRVAGATGQQVGNGAGDQGVSAKMRLLYAGDNTRRTRFIGWSSWSYNASILGALMLAERKTNDVHIGLSFDFSGGNIAVGARVIMRGGKYIQ